MSSPTGFCRMCPTAQPAAMSRRCSSRRPAAEVNWATFETGPLHDRLFREASLGESSVDVAFILNTYATPRITSLFEPLNPYQERDPIEDFEDIFPGLVNARDV